MSDMSARSDRRRDAQQGRENARHATTVAYNTYRAARAEMDAASGKRFHELVFTLPSFHATWLMAFLAWSRAEAELDVAIAAEHH